MEKDKVDDEGYRLNVGIVIVNQENQVFWGQRREPANAWQFPQGGIYAGETTQQALFRELHEEVGLLSRDVEVIAETKNWISYELPKGLRRDFHKDIVGQKQKWFLLRLLCADDKISLDHNGYPEFVQWQWVDYWHPLQAIVEFKRKVYDQVLNEFSSYI